MSLRAGRLLILLFLSAYAFSSEFLLFANFDPGAKPSDSWGGWRIGGVTLDKGHAGAEAVGFLLSPSATGRLTRVEIIAHREKGSGLITAYLMSDAGGPGKVITTVTFPVPPSQAAQVFSAAVQTPVTVHRGKHYWFVLEAENPVQDSVFWPRREDQPATTIAIRRSKSEPWHMNGAFGALLRMYCE
jgi:hypothetical protein